MIIVYGTKTEVVEEIHGDYLRIASSKHISSIYSPCIPGREL